MVSWLERRILLIPASPKMASVTGPTIGNHFLRAGAAIVVQHVDGGAGGDKCDGRDAPDLKTADVLLAAYEGTRERRDVFAAVAGDQGTHQVESQDRSEE